ncbi:MAG TPA: galactose-1-phosphate uridylyltransferase [bacterium]|uniref:Galactose-1-phosphate uridylyltransferase n=1 Tax=candidate division TA06 bacterium ADurb.Bin417 TaxID=1852828 RepID=A0A1V5MJ39_UNCT6|nr:MAG: Galactose-1-phosphate uridylyltransferase [candidate division TA06 bacterium ADurb.Bin417]HNQ34933.1 galactose-1-phosphate uridylyltransferase [bacterium]HNS49149.1 galactose-1-phosphate uridylyltransferase [bacterium]
MSSRLRWDPVLEEWVVIAAHRLSRTFLPPRKWCPLCPTRAGLPATELTEPDYQVAVFENRWPSFDTRTEAGAGAAGEASGLYRERPARGICEVVCYTSDHDRTLAGLSRRQLERLVEVWQDRYLCLGSKPGIKYVFIFENKGEPVGVTLHHPHGQIYAFPYLPPRIKRELDSARRYHRRTGQCLFCETLARELADGRRLVAVNDTFAAFVPYAARWSYEVHVYSRRHLASLAEFGPAERAGLAAILKEVTGRYDRLFDLSFPYMMVFHQAPTDGRKHPGYHFHLEFYPPLRARDKLKYLAGCESGAGTFINDTWPEESAAQLRGSKAGKRRP